MPLCRRLRLGRWRRTGILAAAALSPSCTKAISPLVRPDVSAVALTGGPGTSMVYMARAADHIIVIDLGWWRGRRPITAALRRLDASPDQVTDVFLTHSHRDHVGSWRLLRRSRFHVADAEVPLLLRTRRYRGWVPRLAERVKPSGLPAPNELDIRRFSRDTAFVFGRDTLHAFLVPGHTAGSAVYLFRGVLFLGDAVTHTPWGGFGPARRGYSDDLTVARASLDSLWARLPRGGVSYVCTAHARCAPYSEKFLRDVLK